MERKNIELATKLRHELHAHPELAHHESRTRNHLTNFLREHTSLTVVDRGEWFYAVYRAEAPARRVAFRADFDAVPVMEGQELAYCSTNPGVSHKCGHDGHTASLAAFALEIDCTGCENDVFFIFQHAEETGDGAKECAVLIDEERIDEIFCFHNWPGYPLHTVAIKDGTMNCASRGMILSMRGTPSHASMPEKGRNPVFALAEIINAIPALLAKPHEGIVVCTVIGITAGEKAFGTQASAGELYLTIRAQYEHELDALQRELESMAAAGAEKYGLEWETEYCDSFPETANHSASADKVRAAARELGLAVLEMDAPKRGSEDFGHYLKRTEGAIFFLGSGEDYPQLHTVDFDFPDALIETAVALFSRLARAD